MLELNPKGCTKGTGVLRLCELLGIKRENVYCVGGNENDISMLEVSAVPFAPANAIPGVKAVEVHDALDTDMIPVRRGPSGRLSTSWM